MKKTVVELFAGVGGFRCGLNNIKLIEDKVIEENNWEFVWANQWEPSTKIQPAYDCYVKRFGNLNVSNTDINLIDKKTIPNHTLLVGGFPCQDYSVARSLSNGKGIEGKKGVLWWAIADVLHIKKPPFVLLENVDRLLISPANQRGRDFGIILRSFLDNGYGVEWRVINAADYGEPQKRRRVFIFAYHKTTQYFKDIKKTNKKDIVFNEGFFVKNFEIKPQALSTGISNISKKTYKDLLDINNNYDFRFYNAGIMIDGEIFTAKVDSIKTTKSKNLKDIIETNQVDKQYFLSKDAIKKFEYLKGAKRIPRIKPNGISYNYAEGRMQFPDNLHSPARTMLTSESSVNRSTHVVEDFKTKKLRFITPIEAERINGFPDNWTNTGMTQKRRYFMIGNALVVGLISKMGKELEKIVEMEN